MTHILPTVFISYNPKSVFERTLAMRLHTLGAVHGYKMYLPDRSHHTKGVSLETKARIRHCDYFIIFATSKLSPTVEAEIDEAWEHLRDKTRILVIHDQAGDTNIHGIEHCTRIAIDTEDMKLETINQKVFSQLANLKSPNKDKMGKNSNTGDTLGRLVLAGLALLLLGALLDQD